MSIKRKATKIVLRWALGAAVGMLVSWPVLLGLVLLLLVVIILSSAGGPADRPVPGGISLQDTGERDRDGLVGRTRGG